MRFIIALEASHQRGMGHLFRGLRLGKTLREQGDDVLVACNPDQCSEEIVREKGFPLEIMPDDNRISFWEDQLLQTFSPHWWIDDRLDTDRFHAERLARAGVSHATFDDHGRGADLARFNFLAMEPAPGIRASNGFYGPNYMILDPEITTYRDRPRTGDGDLRIAITLGGSDTYGVTPRAVQTAVLSEKRYSLDVVTGPNFRHKAELASLLGMDDKRIRVHNFVSDLSVFLASVDIVICGAGVTLFEAACLGVPAIIIANEPHEVPVARWFVDQGFGFYAGFQADRFEDELKAGLGSLLHEGATRNKMGQRGKTLVDGEGISRIVTLLKGEGHA